MNTKKRNNLNQLLRQWPRGAVYTQPYLSRLGYYHDLVKSYRRNGWLESVGTGAFKLAGDSVDLFCGLYALQKQLKLPVHVGGRTALELKGFSHYGRPGAERCFLYAPSGTRLPKWFRQYEWAVELSFKATNLFPQGLSRSFSDYRHKELNIMISAPERAAMEMLYHVPSEQGFDEALKILESLMSLRPGMVQTLLENCGQIKVKRLFLYLVEKLGLPWSENLDLDRIDIGKGKRVVALNGVLDKKYLITVPKESLV
jgi:hypothetical protein